MLPGFDLASFGQTAGPIAALLLVAGIIFAESGLLVGFFLPGDSILFTLGILIQGSGSFHLDVNVNMAVIVLVIAAVLGDNIGYIFGKKIGPKLFKKPDSVLFKQENVQKAQEFYEKHGGKTIIIARFTPIIRTLAPIVAGIGKMKYKTFFLYNLIGGTIWAAGVTYLGFFAGKLLHDAGVDVDSVLLPIILIIVSTSAIPAVIELMKNEKRRNRITEKIKETKYLNKIYPVIAKILKTIGKITSKIYGKIYPVISHSTFIPSIVMISGAVLFIFALTNMNNIDLNMPITEWFYDNRIRGFTDFYGFLSIMLDPKLVLFLTVMCSILWVMEKRRFKLALLLMTAVAFVYSIATSLKSLFSNPRPPVEFMARPIEIDYSFPSGHTLTVMVLAFVIAYIVSKVTKRKWAIIVAYLVALILTVVVAISRIYLGYHWMTDVIASIGLGCVAVSIIIVLDFTISQSKPGILASIKKIKRLNFKKLKKAIQKKLKKLKKKKSKQQSKKKTKSKSKKQVKKSKRKNQKKSKKKNKNKRR